MEQWIIRQRIDFVSPPVKATNERPYLLMLPGDNEAHRWEIECLVNGQPASLDGASVNAYFQRPDGALVHVAGTHSGNVCSVVFTEACYRAPGGMRGVMRVSVGAQIITLADRAFFVPGDVSGSAVASDTLPTPAELMAQVATLRQLTDLAMVTLLCNGLARIRVDGDTLYLDTTLLTDESAYEMAVESGYTGTEAQWSEFVAMVTNNTSAIAQAQTAAAAAQAAAAAATQTQSVTVTVSANAWQQNGDVYSATVNCSAATASNTLIVGTGGAMTAEQYDAITQANIVCTGQGAGTITLTAFGAVPEIAITVSVLGVN